MKDSVDFEHTEFKLSDNLIKMYDEYLKLPFGSRHNGNLNIYDKGWCIITGRSIVSPHPHRHYTLNEFILYCGRNQDMYDYFKEKIENKNK